MESFVLAGKAETVFKLIALKAKLEAQKKNGGKSGKGRK